MNNLVVIDSSLILEVIQSNCSKSERGFLLAVHHSNKIREIQNSADLLGTIIGKIYNLSGIKEKPTPLNGDDILKMILSRFNELSLDEIYKAFEFERYGTYDVKTEHYQLFNAEYVATILNKYKNYIQIWKMNNNFVIKKEVEMIYTEAEKESIVLNGLKSAFEFYNTKKVMRENTSHLYDFLDEKGLIDITVEDKKRIFFYAKKSIEVEMREKKCITKEEHTENKRLIDLGVPIDKVKNLAKEIVLKDIFKKLIRNNKTIDNLIIKKK